MTVATITNTSWNFTCKACTVIRNASIVALMGSLSFAESVGRARAASALAQQGHYEAAKYLMMKEYKNDKN